MPGLLEVATKKIKWLTQEKWEVQGGHFSPNGKSVTWLANVDGNTDLYIHDLVSGKTTKLPLPKGLNSFGGAESAFSHDGSKSALLPQRAERSERCLGLSHGQREIDASHAFTDGRSSGAAFCRAVSGALSQPRRQVDDLCVCLCAAQHAAQRAECGDCLHPRRADFAVGEFVQPIYSAHCESGIHGDCAELSRLDGLRQSISAGQSVRYGRRRPAGCSGGGGFFEGDRLSRSEES